MRFAPLLASVCCLCLLLAGCGGHTAATAPQTATNSLGERFDGDANAHVLISNPTNDSWRATVQIERNGTLVLNETRAVPGNDRWYVTTIDRPGNYTFSVGLADGRNDAANARLPLARGDRDTYVADRVDDGQLRVWIYYEQ